MIGHGPEDTAGSALQVPLITTHREKDSPKLARVACGSAARSARRYDPVERCSEDRSSFDREERRRLTNPRVTSPRKKRARELGSGTTARAAVEVTIRSRPSFRCLSLSIHHAPNAAELAEACWSPKPVKLASSGSVPKREEEVACWLPLNPRKSVEAIFAPGRSVWESGEESKAPEEAALRSVKAPVAAKSSADDAGTALDLARLPVLKAGNASCSAGSVIRALLRKTFNSGPEVTTLATIIGRSN